MSFTLSVLAIVLGSSLCEALIPDFPRATAIQDPLLDGVGWSARPTAAPIVPRELFEKRDFLANSASYVLIAPDQTCGYVSALAGAPFQCGTSTNCVFFPVTGSSAYGAVGCCTDPLNCGFKTACVDSSAFSGSGCDGGCQLDANTMKCTDSSAPYCGSIRYAYPSATVQQYFCGTETASTWQTAYTTFSGQSSATRSFKSVNRAVLQSSAASLSSKTASTSSTSSSSTSTSGTTTSSSSTTSGTVAPTQTSAAADKKSSNTGAIVGGLVGGFAVLGMIGAGAFFLYKRKYGKGNGNSPANTPLNNLDPSKQGGAWTQEGVYSPQPGVYSPQQQPQQQAYHPGYQQYQPVPVEMPTEYIQPMQQPQHTVHEKPANTPTTTTMLTPEQSYMSPASTYNNRPISEIGDTSPNPTYRSEMSNTSPNPTYRST
ncbi:uncharacterized protein PAC_03811 [Phialocephala subalpina]|uniref:Uncharacterized protein n=1 Tax=Phialocephala subalpina TaxID=576137 RepID=A0A1L7WMB8_9HELO|nr:uncharacterized protein PAC_03811 [Phialocephala subalpina]